MAKSNTTLTENMIFAATELGISIVQEIAKEALANKSGMSLREFTSVLEQYVARAQVQIQSNVTMPGHIV